MQKSALYALTHVASQLIYRWLPAPALPSDQLPAGARPDLSSLTPSDWRMILQEELALDSPSLPWLPPYLEKRDPGGACLVAAAVDHFQALAAAGGTYLTAGDPAFPPGLLSLRDPPLALSLLGDPSLLELPAVGVVGSRKASGLAVRESFALGRGLASLGKLVVSGGALGCDIAAHHGVLAADHDPARAACVFAGGLACLYPRTNEAVFRRLRDRQGLLISERLWHSFCRPLDFQARNRLIAGLSPLTVVMQAAERSGAMVTARLALDQGRDIAVLTHPPGDVRAAGSAALLDEGAPGFADASELLGKLSIQRPFMHPLSPESLP